MNNPVVIENEILRMSTHIDRIARYPDPRFPPSPYYKFLRLLTEWWKPNLSVELGLCGGGGSLHMALGYPEGTVVGIDISDDYPEQRKYIEEICKNFMYIRTDSVEAAKVEFGKPVDILFIDTVHTYERTMAEYNAWFPKLNGNAIIVLDDLHRNGMMQAWNEIKGYHIQMDYLHPGGGEDGGLGVIIA